MKKSVIIMTAMMLCWLAVWGQPVSRVSYFDEADGLPHGHVTQVLQDELGFIWLSTWNGLCRFDGYEFHSFKSVPGDGCRMSTDRFRDITLRPDGKMICRVDEDYFLFDTRDYRFSNIAEEDKPQAASDMISYRRSISSKTADGASFSCTDRQGNLWYTGKSGIYKRNDSEQNTHRLDIEPKAEVKSLFADSHSRYWIATKEDAAVRVYSSTDDRMIGFLGPDGRLQAGYTRFGAAVYGMYESADGTLWLCTKPNGLFRLREMSAGIFHVDHIGGLPDDNVYSATEDRFGRLWVATLEGGLCFTSEPQADNPHFNTPSGYPTDMGQRLRYLFITGDGNVLMAAATDGLLISRIEENADSMRFRLHQREYDRAGSLSCSATMDVMEDSKGRFFVSTESGGVNRIEGSNLLADTLFFSHYTTKNHLLPNDVVMSLTSLGEDRVMAVSGHLVTILDSAGQSRVLDARYFNSDYRFSDAHPLKLNDDKWLFGLTDGAFTTPASQMYRSAYEPDVVLTAVSIQGGDKNWAVAYTDTLVLQPRERSITVHFAALDFNAPECISYAFRLLHDHERDNAQWNDIGHNRSVTLLDLEPGTYQLFIRSTNADGQWLDNARQLTVIVKPAFWESAWGHLLIVLLIATTLGVIAYTLLYIRRIKRKQHEILKAYLAMIEAETEGENAVTKEEDTLSKEMSVQDQAFMDRVVRFVEEHIADTDANIDGMADAAATSRSVLFRKMKNIVGLTPADFLREARIKRACQLLSTTQNTVADVAYKCGFSDPKYFSKCFKSSIGCSPTEYRSAKEG